jgi:hypothetical protein
MANPKTTAKRRSELRLIRNQLAKMTSKSPAPK